MTIKTLFWIACMAAATGGLGHDLQVLRTSAVRVDVAEAAVRVAGSGDATALRELTSLLQSGPFLQRLDETADPQRATFNLRHVFLALAAKPSAETEALCLKATTSASFAENPVRVGYALEALATVRPLSAAAAAFFERTNAQGYFAHNGPLLASNGSPRAIALLQAMFADRKQSAPDRADLAHEAIVPQRTKEPIVQMVQALSRGAVETEVLVALAESLYDYRPVEWYGKRRDPPAAPAWNGATPEARRAAAALGRGLLSRSDLPVPLRDAITRTLRAL